MTLRTARTGSVTVHAGSASELAAVADEYAANARTRPHGYHSDLFQRAAELLRTGHYPAVDLGAVRFYRDKLSGEPFKGPYAPRPDPIWAARQHPIGVRA